MECSVLNGTSLSHTQSKSLASLKREGAGMLTDSEVDTCPNIVFARDLSIVTHITVALTTNKACTRSSYKYPNMDNAEGLMSLTPSKKILMTYVYEKREIIVFSTGFLNPRGVMLP